MTLDFMDDCAVNEPAPSAFAFNDIAASTCSSVDISSYMMSSPFPDWLEKAKVQVEDLGRLQPGWDSYNARPISAIARTAAYGLLGQLSSPRTPEPTLVPTSDGSVQIEWHTRGIDLEIRVLSSTRVSVCFEDLRGEVASMEDELQYDLTALREAIQALSNR